MQYTQMANKLSKTFIDNLKYDGKDKIYQDSSLAGFAVFVRKSGKTYIVNKRVAGKLHRVVISDISLITLTEAREKAVTIISNLVQGIDPNKKQSDSPATVPTLRECYEYFKSKKTLTDETLKSYDRQILTLLKDWLDIPLNDITKSMISDKHAKLTKDSPAQANASMRVLRSVWNYCRHSFLDDDEEPIIKEQPINILNVKKDWNPIKPKKRHVEEEYLGKFLKAVLEHIDRWSHRQAPYSNNARDIMLVFMLTGVRLNEAQTLAWSDIDLKTGKILFKDTKNGSDYPLPMGDVLWALMRHRSKFAHGSKWVFPSQIKRIDDHVKDLGGSYEVISGKAGLYITPHDLRRTFISVANRLSMNYPVLKRLLNHQDSKTSDDVTLQYIQISQREIREALNEIERVYFAEAGLIQDDIIKKLFA